MINLFIRPRNLSSAKYISRENVNLRFNILRGNLFLRLRQSSF